MMNISGAIILAFFGSLWVTLTLVLGFDVRGWAVGLPFLSFVVITLAALHVHRMPGERRRPSERAGRIIMWSSIGEGLAIPAAIVAVEAMHRPDWTLPAMAVVVGLHFLPMAMLIPFHRYYIPCVVLVLTGLVGGVVGGRNGTVLTGCVAGAAVTLAAVMAVLQNWKSRKTG
jgi:hypothetical protein